MVFAARTGSGEDGERQERGAARTESGEDGDTSESGEDGESGEDEEQREWRERRGSFDATRRRDLLWRMGDGGGK